MNNRLLTILATLIASISLSAQDAATPDPRLAAAQAKHKAERETGVDAPYQKKLGQLNGQLDLALSREEEKAIAAGDLDLVTAIQAERKSLADAGAVPENDEKAHAKVKKFRSAWRSQKAKLDVERTVSANALIAKFAKELEELETTLTQDRKIQDALAVRKLREGLATGALPKVDDGWVTILDGKSLDGWTTEQPRSFQIVERGIQAKKLGRVAGMLFYTGDDNTPDVFRSFEVRMRLHVDSVGSANSGFFFHVPIDDPKGGTEINIANSNVMMNQTGAIWEIKPVKKPLLGQKESFELIIRVTEEEILVTADGKEINRHDPSSGRIKAYNPKGGAIALQSNSIEAAYVFEKIEIRKLD